MRSARAARAVLNGTRTEPAEFVTLGGLPGVLEVGVPRTQGNRRHPLPQAAKLLPVVGRRRPSLALSESIHTDSLTMTTQQAHDLEAPGAARRSSHRCNRSFAGRRTWRHPRRRPRSHPSAAAGRGGRAGGPSAGPHITRDGLVFTNDGARSPGRSLATCGDPSPVGTGFHALRHYVASLVDPARRVGQDRSGSAGACQRGRDTRHLQPSLSRPRRPNTRGSTRCCGRLGAWTACRHLRSSDAPGP